MAGTHGKSTTSGWLVHVLVEAGLDPCGVRRRAAAGRSLTGGLPSTARSGQGEPFVVEADEYAGNFDPYRPDVAVLTSAEWDHPDVFADRAAVVDCFAAWLERAAGVGGRRPVLVANVGDPGVAEVVERLGATLAAARCSASASQARRAGRRAGDGSARTRCRGAGTGSARPRDPAGTTAPRWRSRVGALPRR